MADSMQSDFISEFHSLNGITIGERKKNLFLLLNRISQSLEASETEIDWTLLKPKTPLEEIFKIEILLYFKKILELLKVVKEGNPIFINKIFGTKSWFIEQAFKNISGKELVTELFPYLAYNTKLKLIHKIALYMKNPEKANEYFEAIQESYGTNLASKLLAACSDDLILKSIENKIEITPRHLLIIIKRYPVLTEAVFEKLHQYDCKLKVAEKYEYVFTYLAQNDFQLFLRLKKLYNPYIKLGARTTKKIISKEKQNIIESPKLFYDFLKIKRIGKNLKGDFSTFYLKLFPKSVQKLEEDLDYHFDLLEYLPSDGDRLNMLLKTCKTKHGNELWDHKTFITDKLIKMMSPDDREIWMQTHPRPNHIAEEEWISYMKSEKSIPLLKQKISVTSDITDRAILIFFLVDTCRINKDLAGLLDVCKYMMDKLGNDAVMVHEQFYSSLRGPVTSLKLGEEHWKEINRFVAMWKLNDGDPYTCPAIAEKYIEFCLKNNLEIKELLMDWTKSYYDFNLFIENPEYEKKCLLLFKDIFPKACKKEDLEARHISYLNALRYWNKRHPKDTFSLIENSDAIDHLKSFVQRNQYAFIEEEIISNCIVTDFEKSKEYNLIEILLKRPNYQYQAKIINWILQKQPLFLLEQTELIMENVLKLNYYVGAFHGWFIKYYDHLGIPQKITEMCLKSLDSDSFPEIKLAGRVLSYSMESKEFLNLPAFHPPGLIIDTNTDKEKHIYMLQQALFPYLRNIIPQSLPLATVLKFCDGDYHNLIQRSLYSTALNVSEIQLIPTLDALSEVTFRKHALVLSFMALNNSQSHRILEKCKVSEKYASIKAIFNFFLRNPDDYFWKLAQENVKALNVDDPEAFNILTDCGRVPSSYIVRYVLLIWEVLEEFKNPHEVIEEGKGRVLESITSVNISKLPKEFCEKIIDKYFLKSEDLSSTALKIHSFVCKYIIYYSQGPAQEQSMKLIFATLNNYIKSTWNDLKTYLVGHQTVYNFVKEFCNYFIEKGCLDKSDLLNIFMALWNDSLKPYEAFQEYLHLKLTAMYLECIEEKTTIAQIGEKMANLCIFLNDQGILVANIFSQAFELFKIKFLSVNEQYDPHENEIIMIEAMLKSNKSPCCLIVAASLLSKNILLSPNIQEKYDGIMELLIKESDPLVQIYLHNCLINKD